MWRLLICVLLVVALGSMGLILCRQLRRRREEIENFLLGLRMIETEMTYAASSLGLCFRRAGEQMKGKMQQVFFLTAERLETNCGGEDAFQGALKSCRSELSLTDRDLEWVGRFGISLGVTDMENETKNIRYICCQGDKALSEAIVNEKKWCKVFRSGGWLLGVAAALTFL